MERFRPLGFLREWHEVTGVCNGRVVYDRHTMFPNCEDRDYTSVAFFLTAEELKRELERAKFMDITWPAAREACLLTTQVRRFAFHAQWA
jgi:hypothetical protein